MTTKTKTKLKRISTREVTATEPAIGERFTAIGGGLGRGERQTVTLVDADTYAAAVDKSIDCLIVNAGAYVFHELQMPNGEYLWLRSSEELRKVYGSRSSYLTIDLRRKPTATKARP